MSEHHLEITGIGRRGEGLSSMDGRHVFVPYALPGETVAVNIEGERAGIVSIETNSPDRVDPFCPHFGTCGGCQLQHWREVPYRIWKRGLVEAALRHRGIEATVADLVDAHGIGRRRVSLHVRRKDGVVIAGFMAARSHALQNIDACPILAPALRDAFAIGRRLGEKLGDCDVALTATNGGLDAGVKAERKIAEREAPKLALLCAELDLARLTVNGDTMATRRPPLVSMGGVDVALPVISFLQATEAGETQLAALVMAGLGKAKAVADLFCGCGPFTFRIARVARVAAFDNDKAAIAALSHSARATSGLKPITAEVRDLSREPVVANELKGFDAAVFDPPRAGAEAQARQLVKTKMKTVIAVSCDPVTLARDAEILIGGGFRLETVTPVDQFKWTSHVETVAVFRRS